MYKRQEMPNFRFLFRPCSRLLAQKLIVHPAPQILLALGLKGMAKTGCGKPATGRLPGSILIALIDRLQKNSGMNWISPIARRFAKHAVKIRTALQNLNQHNFGCWFL